MALAEKSLDSARERIHIRRPDVVFVRKPQAKVLPRGLASIVLTALRESDILVKQLIAATNKKDFEALRTKIFRDYVNLSFIIGNSFSVAAEEKPQLRQLVTKEAFKLVEEILHKEGIPRLGCDVIREANFCLDTLRRAHRLIVKIHAYGKAPEGTRERDRELSSLFTRTALWSQLHLDCIRVIVTAARNPRVEPDVLEDIMNGARLSVMAYSYARQGLELRKAQDTYLVESVPLDAEDEELLEESYSDYVESESINAEP